jgi:hypothetical protein
MSGHVVGPFSVVHEVWLHFPLTGLVEESLNNLFLLLGPHFTLIVSDAEVCLMKNVADAF